MLSLLMTLIIYQIGDCSVKNKLSSTLRFSFHPGHLSFNNNVT